MKVKFNFATGNWNKNEIVDLPEPFAMRMINLGAAVVVDEIEQATAEPVMETAEAPRQKRKRGRPRKIKVV